MNTLHTPVSLSVTNNKSEKQTKLSLMLLFCCFIVLAGINPITATAEAVAGSIPGKLSVGQNGSANYSIPIGVPSGVAGMQPDLSINYNSNGGNGMLGLGFALNGISVITRCPATYEQDGFKGGIYFDHRDRYCMDGQRLIAISGNDGAPGTEYRTEIDSFSRIVSYGQQGSSYWKVWTKSGLILEYGNSGDARVETRGGAEVRTWAVSSISDVVGNTITFSYYENNTIGEHYPLSVDYAGNSVQFEYESRPDPSYGYLAGGKVSLTKRLARIILQSAGTKVDEYVLRYLDNNKSLLAGITHHDANGNTMPELVFDWDMHDEDEQKGFGSLKLWSYSVTRNQYYRIVDGNADGVYSQFIDINGDGLPDRVSSSSSEGQGIRVALNTGKGFGESKLWDYSVTDTHYYRIVNKGAGRIVSSQFLDINGDGLPDRVSGSGNEAQGVRVALNTGTGFATSKLWRYSVTRNRYYRIVDGDDVGIYAQFLDINGDGLPDRVSGSASEGEGVRVSLNNGSGFDGEVLWPYSVNHSHQYRLERTGDYGIIGAQFLDINGDGLPDRVNGSRTEGQGVWVSLNTGEGFEPLVLWRYSVKEDNYYRILDIDVGGTITSQFLDINGDGLPDRVSGSITYGAGVWVALNNGKGFESPVLWEYSAANDDYYRIVNTGGTLAKGVVTSQFLDINGDGLPDRVSGSVVDGRGVWVALNNGHGFDSPALWKYSVTNDDYYHIVNGDGYGIISSQFQDINGDGMPDKVSGSGNEALGIRTTINKQRSYKVRAITSGKGTTNLIYKHLTDSSVYTKGTGASYPEMDMAGPLQVVSRVITPDGLGSTNSTDYKYGGMKVNVRGRGNLGFAWMQLTDNQSGIVTRTEYSQTFPNVGQVTRTTQTSPSGVTLGETIASVDYIITHVGNRAYKGKIYGDIYFPYSPQVVETRNDLDGTWLATITTDSAYDLFGNATNIKVTTVDSHDTVIQETANVYPDDAARVLGRLSRATVTHTNAQGSIIRTSSFEYNPDGLLSREIIEPDNIDLRLQTDYQYDSYGNKTLVTTSGQSIETRSSTTTYSADGRFPISVTNALGHTETRTYDSVLGVMTSLTGPNGLTTTWQYDGFGRKIREDRADGTWTTITRGMCDSVYCPDDAPLGTNLYTITQSSGSTPVAEYSDQLGRVTRKVTTGFDGTLVYLDTEYNKLGQVSRSSQPYFKGEASHWDSNEYDLMGRVTRVSRQGPNGTIDSTFVYSGYTVTSTDAKGHVKVTEKSVQDKVLRVDEEEGGWVTYIYDAVGNLLETNANGVVTTLIYDSIGHNKIDMNDPDMGHWTYVYDVLNNLISQTDANGQTVSMVYDKLGRMVQRTEPEGVTTWTYDTYDSVANGVAAHSIGKLIQVDAPDGYQQVVTYDSLGRASTTTTTADGQTLTTTTEYDSFGRVSRTIRPEGFVVENAYNTQGYLEAVRTPAALIGDYVDGQLSQVWSEIEQPLVTELEQAQQNADELYAQAAVYRERAQYYWDRAQLLREQAPNKGFLEDDRKATIAELQQTSTDLNQLATKLEQKAAEYQLLANSILSLMPTNWQANWFLDAKARYDQYARNAIAKIEAAYQVNENTLVWVPINVGGITIFIQAKPGFQGADAITAREKAYLEDIGNWEAGTAELLRAMAASARAQQAAKDKYQTALANHPAMVWVPIDVDGITTMMYVPSAPLTPEQVLTEEELQLYNAPDLLQTDGITLAEFYTNRALEQVALQREIEDQREYYARTASRLSQTLAAYSDAIAQLQGTESQVTFWHATGRDAAGRLTSSVVGNGLETRNFYDQATGQLTYITSGFGSFSPVRELNYEYDALNNVTSRIDRVQGMTESFEYDRLDRLTRSNVQGRIGQVDYNRSVDYSYDAMGNILNKSDIGDYSYGNQNRSVGNAGPHAVVSAGLAHTGYQYDNNGNMLQGGGRGITWSSFNKPTDFSKDGVWNTSFKYGPDRSRYLKVTQSSRTLYLGKSYERIETGTKIEHKHFIYADGNVVAIHVKTTDNGVAQLDQTRYLHRDSLGSIDTITDGTGQIVDRMSYEPFGARRDGDWRVGTGALYIPTLTNRGFTGHEHVDEMNLIHMNGRVYDPELGRFLSADPKMQFPHQSQGYNRYAYVQNNPLKYTDPSGYDLFGDIVRIVVIAVIVYVAWYAVINSAWATTTVSGATWGSVAAGAAGGFVGGLISSGGSLEAAAIGAVTGAAFAYVGHGMGFKDNPEFMTGQYFAKTVAHGVVGGASASAQGGKFEEGFWSAAFTQAAAPALRVASSGKLTRTLAAAVVGGTAASIGGGKFENGAMTGAFSRLFNDEAGALKQKQRLYRLRARGIDSSMIGDARSQLQSMMQDAIDTGDGSSLYKLVPEWQGKPVLQVAVTEFRSLSDLMASDQMAMTPYDVATQSMDTLSAINGSKNIFTGNLIAGATKNHIFTPDNPTSNISSNDLIRFYAEQRYYGK